MISMTRTQRAQSRVWIDESGMFETASLDEALPRRRENLDCHELDTEVILYDHVFNTTYRLNETGYAIWKSCDGATDSVQIAQLLMDKFDVSEPKAHRDVQRFISMMQKDGLLVTRGDLPE